MPYDYWKDIQTANNEFNEEEERVAHASARQRDAEAALDAAKKKTFGRKAAVARLQATLDELVAREKERLEARKVMIAERSERLHSSFKAKPYQVWIRDNWGDSMWRCNGGWHRLADAVERMEWLVRPDGYLYAKELEIEIRSSGGAVLYRFSRAEEAKKRAEKWLPNTG
jgi:hypothetical protein